MKDLKHIIESFTEFQMTFLISILKLATHCSLGPILGIVASFVSLYRLTMLPTRGTRPKSAMPVSPSWMRNAPTTPASNAPTTSAANPSSQPHSAPAIPEDTRITRDAGDNSVSISFTMGPMSTSIQFGSEAIFSRHGFQILQQAHSASLQLAMMSTQMTMNQTSHAMGFQMMPGAQSMRPANTNPTSPGATHRPAILAGTSPGTRNQPALTAGDTPPGTRNQLAVADSTTPGAISLSVNASDRTSGVQQNRAGVVATSSTSIRLWPAPSDINWPFLRDPTLPRTGWNHSGGIFWHLPRVVADEMEESDLVNEALMFGTLEVCWLQNPVFRVWKPLQKLKVYSNEGPLTISDAVTFNWEKMINIFLQLRSLLASSLSRRKSANEIRLPRFDFTMLPSSLVETTIDYLGQLLPQPIDPPNLAVDVAVWRDLANVILASHTVDYVTGMRIIKLNENWVGLIADLHLTHGIARPEVLEGNVQRYYVAHNTDWNAAAHILHQGIWRPSSYDPRDVTWSPSSTFYARGHMYDEKIAMLQAATHKSSHRPCCVLGRSIIRQYTHVKPKSGGIPTDIAASMYYDIARAKDGRWAFRVSASYPTGFAVWEYQD